METIQVTRSCDNCVNHMNKQYCSKYCISHSLHVFNCDYCKHKLQGNRFCEMEDPHDGSMNCCGDAFELDAKFIVV